MTIEVTSRKLLQELMKCKQRFEQLETKPEKSETYFYHNVKPAFEHIMEIVSLWEPMARKWVLVNKPKNIHTSQIDSTVENIEHIVLQSFYKDTNKQRFQNMYHSVEFVITAIFTGVELKKQ
ncbi:DUF1798 family protein [Metabacillus malikii]|uniref:DUF1798 family protein n=1 Tax=Metabacillus malikii TaxID=1504265 RepID=UPI0027D907E2|nr:DUF1798 family protein [Metabacillus malikii]